MFFAKLKHLVEMIPLTAASTILITLTTPNNHETRYQKLIHTENESGQKIWEVVHAGNVCEDCAELPSTEWPKCTHGASDPPWHDPERRENASRMINVLSGGTEMAAQEMMGRMQSGSVRPPAFDPKDVDHLFNTRSSNTVQVVPVSAQSSFPGTFTPLLRAPLDFVPPQPAVLLTSVDPCGEGDSRFAIVTLMCLPLEDPHVAIVSADLEFIKGTSGADLLRAHMQRVGDVYSDLNPIHVLVVEANANADASFLGEKAPKNTLHRCRGAKLGFAKNNGTTVQGRNLVYSLLQRKRISFERSFTTAHPQPKDLFNLMWQQLLFFYRKRTPKGLVTYSGKGTSAGDDWVCALSQGVLCLYDFIEGRASRLYREM